MSNLAPPPWKVVCCRRGKHRCWRSISIICHNIFKCFLEYEIFSLMAMEDPFCEPLARPSHLGWFPKCNHLTTQGQTQGFYFFRLEEVDLSGICSKISLYIFHQHSWVKGQTEIWKRWLLPLWGRRIPTESGTYMNSDLQSFPLFMRSLDLLLLSPIYKELWLDQGKEYQNPLDLVMARGRWIPNARNVSVNCKETESPHQL